MQEAAPAKAAAPADKKKAKSAKDVDVKAAKGSSTIFVKNLAWAVGEDELYEFFGACGEIVDARVGESPGCVPICSSLIYDLELCTPVYLA